MAEKLQIATTYIALDDAGRGRPLPVNETFWPDLIHGRLGEFSRLVSSMSFDADWPTWEKHPAGEEFVCLLEGEVDLVLDQEGKETVTTLSQPGEYVLIPPDTWHTAKVRRASKMMFITPGEGTENKPL